MSKEKLLETIKSYMEFYPPVTRYNSIGSLSIENKPLDDDGWTDDIEVSSDIFPLLMLLYKDGKIDGDFFISITSDRYDMGRGCYPHLNLLIKDGELKQFIPAAGFCSKRMYDFLYAVGDDEETEVYMWNNFWVPLSELKRYQAGEIQKFENYTFYHYDGRVTRR